MRTNKKVIKFGGSVGVILPQIFLDTMKVKEKDLISITYDEVSKSIILKKEVLK